jgi:hypothetical protein
MKDSQFEGPAALVVTSISAPNPVLRELASQCKARGLTFYVIGDVPSPADFSLEGCEFYSLERQRSTGLKLAGLLPTRHYARKNIGYLLAMRAKSGLLLETDDDNLPGRSSGMREQPLAARAHAQHGNGWTNIYAYFLGGEYMAARTAAGCDPGCRCRSSTLCRRWNRTARFSRG